MANTVLFQEIWEESLQARLDAPSNWKDVCDVIYTNERVIHKPYINSPTVQTTARGSAYTYQDWTETDDSLTISTIRILPTFIDRADLAQSKFTSIVDLAKRQGRLVDEAIESNWLSLHTNWTDFGTSSIGGGGAATTPITVSATNVDDICRGVVREIREANGQEELSRNGAFIVWRAADFEILEGFAQANGYGSADDALKNGLAPHVKYLGIDHYVSTLHTANHLIGGVKKVYWAGVLKDTYGKVYEVQEPAGASGGNVSAVGIVTRADFGFELLTNVVPIVFDINVA